MPITCDEQMPMTIASWLSAPICPERDDSSGVVRATVARYGGTRQMARPHDRPATKLASASGQSKVGERTCCDRGAARKGEANSCPPFGGG